MKDYQLFVLIKGEWEETDTIKATSRHQAVSLFQSHLNRIRRLGHCWKIRLK